MKKLEKNNWPIAFSLKWSFDYQRRKWYRLHKQKVKTAQELTTITRYMYLSLRKHAHAFCPPEIFKDYKNWQFFEWKFYIFLRFALKQIVGTR